jgi:hypothetical protein
MDDSAIERILLFNVLMGRAGFEHPALTTPKTPISDVTRTESGTVNDDHAIKSPNVGAIKAQDLIRMVELCQDLNEETKTKILDLIDSQIPSPKSPRKENDTNE